MVGDAPQASLGLGMCPTRPYRTSAPGLGAGRLRRCAVRLASMLGRSVGSWRLHPLSRPSRISYTSWPTTSAGMTWATTGARSAHRISTPWRTTACGSTATMPPAVQSDADSVSDRTLTNPAGCRHADRAPGRPAAFGAPLVRGSRRRWLPDIPDRKVALGDRPGRCASLPARI